MKLMDSLQIASGFVPVDLATAGGSGDYVSMKGFSKLVAVLFKAAGAVGEAPTITAQQASDVSGTGAKALNFTEIWSKSNADITTIGQFTKVTQAAANTYAMAAGNTQGIVAIEFDASDLDVSGGFDCVRVTIADVGSTAQLACVFYILGGAAYPQAQLPSAIAD